MRQLLSRQPLRRQVLLGALVLVLPVFVAMIWSASLAFHEREADLREQTLAVVASERAYLNQELRNFDLLAAGLSRYDSVRSLGGPGADRLLASVAAERPLLLNIVVTDPAAGVHLIARPAAMAPARYAEACAALVSRTGESCVGDYQTDAMTGQPTVVLAYPIRRSDGAVTGVLDFALNLLSLQRVFAAIPLPAGSVVTLTDRTSRVLARSRDAEKFIGVRTSPHPLVPDRVPQINLTRGLDGVSDIFGTAVIERGPWVLSVGIPVRVAADRAWPVWWRDLAITFAALGVSVLLGFLLIGRISRPIGALTAAAQRIAGGDWRPPEPIETTSLELGRLQEAFTTMADHLRATRAELDEEIERERTARRQVQLLQSQVVRQERLAAVGLLVSGIAHELNNPLQAIVGTSEIVAREPSLPPGLQSELQTIKKHGTRARDIIRNLSRFVGRDASPSAEVKLADVIEAALQLRTRDGHRDDGVECRVEIESQRSVVAGFTELQQVVLNFVTNAEQAIAERTHGAGRIAIRVRDVGDAVRVEVADNGPGVRPEDQAKLFQPFFTTRPVGQGTGLGLSVSYGIIDASGGRIGYLQNEWGGATFYFELPAWPVAAAAWS